MCKILMPIKPKFTKAIFNQEKTYELRRQIPKRQVKQILIYETAPSSKVVGIITVKKLTHYLLPNYDI